MTVDLLALFSEDSFCCLDFADLTSVNKAQSRAVLQVMDRILDALLYGLDYRHISRPKDVAFRKDLWAWGQTKLSKVICDDFKLDILLDTTASSMEYFYPSSSHEFKMCEGTATLVAILADDLLNQPGRLDELNHFSQRYLRGLAQPEGICDALAEAFTDVGEFFGSKNPRLGSSCVISWLAGIDSFCDEAKFAVKLPDQLADTCLGEERTKYCVDKLPFHIRNLSGLGPSYFIPIFKPTRDVEVPSNLWVTAIPYLNSYVVLINDLLSFSKEFLALENYNYLSLTTRAKRQTGYASRFGSNHGPWTFRDTLYETSSQVLSDAAAVDGLFVKFADSLSKELEVAQARAEVDGLAGEEKENQFKNSREQLENAWLAAKLWTEFRHGYVGWHISHPRYQLDSLRASVAPKFEQNGTKA